MIKASEKFGSSGFVPSSIVNGESDGLSRSGGTFASNFLNAKNFTIGACTAGVLKTVLSVTGKGALGFCCLKETGTTARSQRVRITIDGEVAFDATLASPSVNNSMTPIIGHLQFGYNGGWYVTGGIETQILFNSSLLIEYSTSLTETTTSSLYINHYLG